MNPGPLACFVFLFRQEVAQSENHTTRPHAHVSVGVLNKELNYEWIDLTTEEIQKTGSVKGNNMVTFLPPEGYPGVLQSKDWILHIYEK